jgi:hypothetical protein
MLVVRPCSRDKAGLVLPSGTSAGDSWQSYHAGFRSDWTLTPQDTLTVTIQIGKFGRSECTLF